MLVEMVNASAFPFQRTDVDTVAVNSKKRCSDGFILLHCTACSMYLYVDGMCIL